MAQYALSTPGALPSRGEGASILKKPALQVPSCLPVWREEDTWGGGWFPQLFFNIPSLKNPFPSNVPPLPSKLALRREFTVCGRGRIWGAFLHPQIISSSLLLLPPSQSQIFHLVLWGFHPSASGTIWHERWHTLYQSKPCLQWKGAPWPTWLDPTFNSIAPKSTGSSFIHYHINSISWFSESRTLKGGRGGRVFYKREMAERTGWEVRHFGDET